MVPLFDYPHIFKCIRNNWLNKDLEIHFDNKNKAVDRKICSWSHIEVAYEIDVFGPQQERSLPKWTKDHVYELNINKMKVKSATQIFSKQGGECIKNFAEKQGTVNKSYSLFLNSIIKIY